jgi:hypothetical protein
MSKMFDMGEHSAIRETCQIFFTSLLGPIRPLVRLGVPTAPAGLDYAWEKKHNVVGQKYRDRRAAEDLRVGGVNGI